MKARSRTKIQKPKEFSFVHTVKGHGWYDLAPFEINEEEGTLNYVIRDSRGAVSEIKMTDREDSIVVDFDRGVSRELVRTLVCRILRMEEDYGEFYAAAGTDAGLKWAAASGAGRMLRSATVFEDLVKSLCTTNCSWGLTKNMVKNLVDSLGEESPSGRRAFPTAAAMAEMDTEFYRSEIRAGYRSPYFVELAESVATGRIDPERWLCSELPTADLKKELKQIKGIGDYAAENLLKLLGRYDGLALDSWLRAQYYKKHNRGITCDDKKIERHYRKFGEWRGLAIWCDMTEDWFAKN